LTCELPHHNSYLPNTHETQTNSLTQILESAQQGDSAASAELLPLVYAELRRLAASRLAQERPGQTLQPTALVHEAWLRLVTTEPKQWNGRNHFFGAAALAMRRILVEKARRKRRLKHGGELQRVEIEEIDLPSPMPDDEILALDEALDKLAQVDPEAAQLIQLCFFCGLTQAEAGEQLGISRATAERTWSFARAWLFKEIRNLRDLSHDPTGNSHCG
jgi:RNA polymerase sigma factor (TIGR02999 family)